jgi:hypothetical protein
MGKKGFQNKRRSTAAAIIVGTINDATDRSIVPLSLLSTLVPGRSVGSVFYLLRFFFV